MKIAVYYDSLISKGGAERVVIQLANALNADIITSGFRPDIRQWMPINGHVIDIGNILIKISKPIGVLFEAPIRYLYTRKKLDYDVHIFCGFTSIYGAKKSNYNIWYCFTPNRIMYDLKSQKLKEGSKLKRFLLRLHIMFFSNLDKNIITNNINQIISQSKCIQQRVAKYYKRKSKIIYSPVNVKEYEFSKFGDYYLTVSRLFTEKRVDLLVNAFLELPDKKLIIVGTGPEKTKILQLIKKSNNIRLLTNVSDKKLKCLYANCLATIYIPKSEDYGLIPLEGMASGKMCIGVNEGGLKETIINNKTGYLIEANKRSIKDAVNLLTPETALKMMDHCFQQASKFDLSICVKRWRNLIASI